MNISLSVEVGLIFIGIVLILFSVPGVTEIVSDLLGKPVRSVWRKSTRYALIFTGIFLVAVGVLSILKLPHSKSNDSENSISIGGDVDNSTIIQSEGDVYLAPTVEGFEKILDSVEVEGNDNNVLVAYNPTGNSIWRREFACPIVKAIIDDIDSDGDKEIFLGFGFNKSGEDAGYLLVLDESGNEIDRINTWMESIYSGAAKPKSRIVDFVISDLLGNGEKVLLAISNDVYWYASRVVVVSFFQDNLGISRIYWNPGLLYTINVVDLDANGVKEIILTGVNNDLQYFLNLGGNVHVAFLLQGDNIIGQAPPWLGKSKKGTELWYAYFAPSEVQVTQVFFDEDINNDGIADVQIALEDGCSFYVDILGNLIGYGRGSVCKGTSKIGLVP